MKSKQTIDSPIKLKLFVLAGEASGDKIGADLIKKIRKEADLNVIGVGGINMIAQGLKSLYPITDLSVMGYVDVAFRLPLLLWRVRQTVRYILAQKPDIVVLIDSQVFSNLVAKGLKKNNFQGPILLYVSPTVWGYKPERAQHILPLYDEVLAILPFEPHVMAQLGGPKCRYVGHPAINTEPKLSSLKKPDTIILLPGSRTGELRRHLPMFEKSVAQIIPHYPQMHFALPTLPHLAADIANRIKHWSVPVEIVTESKRRNELYARSVLAVTVAGTTTLELAVARVPMVVAYIMDMGMRQIEKTIDLKHFSLPNLILDEALVPELLMHSADSLRLTASILDLLSQPQKQTAQKSGFARMQHLMERGTPEFPRENPAQCVLSYLNKP